jgi:hypothetical protein
MTTLEVSGGGAGEAGGFSPEGAAASDPVAEVEGDDAEESAPDEAVPAPCPAAAPANAGSVVPTLELPETERASGGARGCQALPAQKQKPAKLARAASRRSLKNRRAGGEDRFTAAHSKNFGQPAGIN